jgi:hypothetical protein
VKCYSSSTVIEPTIFTIDDELIFSPDLDIEGLLIHTIMEVEAKILLILEFHGYVGRKNWLFSELKKKT